MGEIVVEEREDMASTSYPILHSFSQAIAVRNCPQKLFHDGVFPAAHANQPYRRLRRLGNKIFPLGMNYRPSDRTQCRDGARNLHLQ